MSTEQQTLSAYDAADERQRSREHSTPTDVDDDLEAVVELVDRYGAVLEKLVERVSSPSEPADSSAPTAPDHADWGIQ